MRLWDCFLNVFRFSSVFFYLFYVYVCVSVSGVCLFVLTPSMFLWLLQCLRSHAQWWCSHLCSWAPTLSGGARTQFVLWCSQRLYPWLRCSYICCAVLLLLSVQWK